MAITISRAKLTAQAFRNLAARSVELQKDLAAMLSYNSTQEIDWATLEKQGVIDELGNIDGEDFSREELANAIGSLDWVNKLLTNQSMTGSQGNHLGNLQKLASP